MANHADAAERTLSGAQHLDDDDYGEAEKITADGHAHRDSTPQSRHDEPATETSNPVEYLADSGAHTGAHHRISIWRRHARLRPTVAAGSLCVLALACAAGYLGYGYSHDQHETMQRNLYLASGRQAAVNLTTIDYTHVDADLARILNSATGRFHDDFQTRSQPFIDVVKQAQSKSEGTVTEAALQSQSKDHAEVLVAVSVVTSSAGAPQQNPRLWRMRISLQDVGGSAKVSDVQFVT
jgi:Mce-associated membrane protein